MPNFLLLLLQISQFLEPNYGWALHKDVKIASSVSARVTSDDSRSFLVVRCDRSKRTVVSVQYIPIEDVGFSGNSIQLNLLPKDGRKIALKAVWTTAKDGIFVRDDDWRVGAFIRKMSSVAGRLEVHAKDQYGTDIIQRFDNDRGRNNLTKVLNACELSSEEAWGQ